MKVSEAVTITVAPEHLEDITWDSEVDCVYTGCEPSSEELPTIIEALTALNKAITDWKERNNG